MHQYFLLAPESIPPRARYEKLFDNLPELPSERTRQGRPPVPRHALLKGLIYRNLRGITKLVELEFELRNNPSIAEPLELDPRKKLPSDERFSEFLRSNPNGYFQHVREALVHQLITEGVISGRGVGLDSCPIEALVRENNLKTSMKDRYDKYRLPPGDTDVRLGVCVSIYQAHFRRSSTTFGGIETTLSMIWTQSCLKKGT